MKWRQNQQQQQQQLSQQQQHYQTLLRGNKNEKKAFSHSLRRVKVKEQKYLILSLSKINPKK
jgi:hypothetical protein